MAANKTKGSRKIKNQTLRKKKSTKKESISTPKNPNL